jgi:hypothetical protein
MQFHLGLVKVIRVEGYQIQNFMGRKDQFGGLFNPRKLEEERHIEKASSSRG